MLDPHLLDQRMAFENQFQGMSEAEFSYDDYEATRLRLIETIKTSLREEDKAFLLSLNRFTPDWLIVVTPFTCLHWWVHLQQERLRERWRLSTM